MKFSKHDFVPAAASSSMRPSASLLLSILIGASCWTVAHGNPVYSVTGVAVGTRVQFDSEAYHEYRCGPSQVFGGLTLCVKTTDDTDQRSPFVAYDGLLHSRDGTVVYVSRYQDPAYWRDDEVEEDIGYYSRELGEAPTFLTMPTRDELPNAVIATWGKIVLEPVDGASQKILAAGKNPKIGALIDFLGNYELSTKNDLPVYRVSGGAGFIWAASWESNGRGNLRMLAINPSELPTPANLNPPDQAEANLSDSNPLASFAHKPLHESVGIGFFVSAEGHILTDGLLTRDCQHITSSHGGHIKRIAFDQTSDLALLMSSEKPDAWASLRGGSAPQVAEPVMTMGFPVGTISALAGLGNDRRMIQISTPVQPANSGSPLLDRSGSVVGIVAGKLNAIEVAGTAGDITQNANFAFSLGTIQSFLDSHAVPYASRDSTETKNYADIAAEAMRYTVLLECAD
jgi:S1-C subfamily serine protease